MSRPAGHLGQKLGDIDIGAVVQKEHEVCSPPALLNQAPRFLVAVAADLVLFADFAGLLRSLAWSREP